VLILVENLQAHCSNWQITLIIQVQNPERNMRLISNMRLINMHLIVSCTY